jgi:hypothetical protein
MKESAPSNTKTQKPSLCTVNACMVMHVCFMVGTDPSYPQDRHCLEEDLDTISRQMGPEKRKERERTTMD